MGAARHINRQNICVLACRMWMGVEMSVRVRGCLFAHV